MTGASKDGVTLETICSPSEDIVAREIEGDIVIVPLVAGIGGDDDELFTLNDTGKAIWNQLDGKRTLGDVARAVAGDFDGPLTEIQADVLGFAREMTVRRILAVRT